MNTPTTNADLTFIEVPMEKKTCDQIFFDGFTEILVSPAISKATFHHVVGLDSESGKEQRQRRVVLSMPTAVFIEFCQTYLNQVKDVEKMLTEGLERQKSLILSVSRKKAE